MDEIKFSLFTYRNQMLSEKFIYNQKILLSICDLILNEKNIDWILIVYSDLSRMNAYGV